MESVRISADRTFSQPHPTPHPQVTIKVADLALGTEQDAWHVLQKRSWRSHVAGELRLRVGWRPAEEPTKPAATALPLTASEAQVSGLPFVLGDCCG